MSPRVVCHLQLADRPELQAGGERRTHPDVIGRRQVDRGGHDSVLVTEPPDTPLPPRGGGGRRTAEQGNREHGTDGASQNRIHLNNMTTSAVPTRLTTSRGLSLLGRSAPQRPELSTGDRESPSADSPGLAWRAADRATYRCVMRLRRLAALTSTAVLAAGVVGLAAPATGEAVNYRPAAACRKQPKPGGDLSHCNLSG